MKESFSTLRHQVDSGRIFSTQAPAGTSTISPRGSVRTPAAKQVALTSVSLPPVGNAGEGGVKEEKAEVFRFLLLSDGLPAAAGLGHAARGEVEVAARPQEHARVTARISGLTSPPDAAISPTLWLIHDLRVPLDLDAADLARLQVGANGAGNRPGGLFTLDGNVPTYGPDSNTLSVAISPGQFLRDRDGHWYLDGRIDGTSGQAFHPLAVLGPAVLPNINEGMPAAMVARVLTDMFMRPATIHPELRLPEQFGQRLLAVVADVQSSGSNGVLSPKEFDRAAVTLEGLVRTTPRLMPTRESCCLMALGRQ